MLLLLPPSEGKTAPDPNPATNVTLDLSTLDPGAEPLNAARAEVLERLRQVSAREDALELLGVGRSLAAEVAANRELTSAPCAPAYHVYSGVLYEAGNLAERGSKLHSATSHSKLGVLVQSALFGVVDLAAMIPAYRLSMGVKLPEIGGLAAWWRPRLQPVMDELAGGGIVVDARSGEYRKAWTGKTSDAEIVAVSVVRERDGKRRVVSHEAKRYRGLLAGALIDRAEQVEETLDFVIETARSLTHSNAGAQIHAVDVRETKTGLDLQLVTH